MPIKIAIYSGEIPSTTFIERLIIGLSESDSIVYLFGKQNKKINYPQNIQLFTHSGRFNKLLVLIKYSILFLVILIVMFKNLLSFIFKPYL